MTTADQIVEYARSYKGVPWRHQGRADGPHRAVDCAGLLVVTAAHFDLPYEDMKGYRRDPGKQFKEQIELYTDPCRTRQLWHGAIAIFTDTSQPCHCGILAVDEEGEVTVIHSEAAPAKRCHEEGLFSSTPSLRSRLIAVRHYKDVKYG